MRKKKLVSGGILVLTLLISAALRAEGGALAKNIASIAQAEGAGQTVPTGPIYDADDALARSLEHLSKGLVPVQVVVRQLRLEAADIWIGSRTNDFSSSEPVWLVGIVAEGLEVGDVLRGAGLPSSDDREAVGAFFLWDAAGGHTIAEGALLDSADLATMARLADERLPITATTPEAIPTLDPAVRAGAELPRADAPSDATGTLP